MSGTTPGAEVLAFAAAMEERLVDAAHRDSHEDTSDWIRIWAYVRSVRGLSADQADWEEAATLRHGVAGETGPLVDNRGYQPSAAR